MFKPMTSPSVSKSVATTNSSASFDNFFRFSRYGLEKAAVFYVFDVGFHSISKIGYF